jgi:hypothetical protein
MKIKALEPFLDGNILARAVDRDQVVEVTLREYEMIVQSGGKFEVVPDDTEVTLVPVERNLIPPLLTEKELKAKQLREQHELEARQKLEKENAEAQSLANADVEVVMNVTATDEPQATRAAEELTARKLAEKKAAEERAAADKANKEVAAEVSKETKAEKKKATG